MPKRNQIVLLLILAFLTVSVAVIPDIVSDDLKAWCLLHLGPDYSKYLIGLFITGSLVLFFLSSDLRKGLFAAKGNGAIETAKIPWSPAAQQFLQSAKENIAAAAPEETIKALRQLKNTFIEEQLSLISTRLAQFRKEEIEGVLTQEQKETQFSRINNDLFSLIKTIENQLTAGQKENKQLRDAFRARYSARLAQKLASRQPVNLRRFATQEGTSKIVADTFVPYNSEAIKVEIGKTFQDAYGRLLIVGQPGAGKTTLLLQLADRLFDLETDALPVVLNLATWKSSFGTLEAWILAVMAAELGTNQAGAKAALRQANLIVLLDGLDELKEDAAMNSCLAAIAEYGSVARRKFVITCRIEEYKRVQEDARVNLQIEVGPLQGDQLEAELNRMGREQPEAMPLLQAIQNDPLLREAVEIPFYFNTLQLLFAGRLPVFTTTDLDSRKQEIKQLFIQSSLQRAVHKNYPATDSMHWLSFLAANMNERNLVVFELRDLQYTWWRGWSRWNKVLSFFIFEMLFVLLSGLLFGLMDGLIYGLLFVLLYGLIFGLMDGLMPLISTTDAVMWSVKAYIKSIKSNLTFMLLFGQIAGWTFMLLFGQIVGWTFGLIVGWGSTG